MKNNDEVKLLKELKNSINNADYELVLKIRKRLTKANPSDSQYWLDYIHFTLDMYEYFNTDEWDNLLNGAIEACQKARKNIPEKYHSQLYVFEYKLITELIDFDISYYDKYEDEDLEALLNEAIRLRPDNVAAYKERANFYFSNDMREKANSDYKMVEKLEENSKNDSDLYIGKAANNELLNNYDEAISDYLKLFNSSEDKMIKIAACNSLIHIYKLSDNKERINYYEEIIENLQ